MRFAWILGISRGYRDVSLYKKQWFRTQYPHHRFIVEELDNANDIHAFNRFEEKGHLERFQHHFRLIDLACDAMCANDCMPKVRLLPKINEGGFF